MRLGCGAVMVGAPGWLARVHITQGWYAGSAHMLKSFFNGIHRIGINNKRSLS